MLNNMKTRTLVTPLRAVLLTIALGAAGAFATAAFAEDGNDFVDKKYSISGDWYLVEEEGRTIIRFSDSFKTKGGPDLKVFLSPTSIDDASGKNATSGSVLLGALQSTSGGQDYVLPEGTNLSDFSSVLVHCEQFSVLWGGGAL